MAKFRAIRLYQYTSRGKWYQIDTEFESEYNHEIREAIKRAQIVEVVEAKPIEKPKPIEQATTEQGSDDKKRRSKGEKEVTSTEKTADAEKGVGE